MMFIIINHNFSFEKDVNLKVVKQKNLRVMK